MQENFTGKKKEIPKHGLCGIK